ncbi:hypothetical protein PCE1_001264 [Barthelona sp. PCE]
MDRQAVHLRRKYENLMNERKILSTAKHPNISTLYFAFHDDLYYYLAMDFHAGGSLYTFLQNRPNKRVQLEVARYYAIEVLSALEYLHVNLNVVYRDLKPENILIDMNGHLVLTDFDLSMQIPENYTAPDDRGFFSKLFRKKRVFTDVYQHILEKTMTYEMHKVLGTYEYLAPEVIDKTKGYNVMVDFWGLGILLYEMVFGFTPFVGHNSQKTMHNIMNRELYFPKLRNVHISNNFVELISGLLCKDPMARLGSNEGVREILAHPFFKQFTVADVMARQPYHVPKLDSEWDTSNFPELPIRNSQDKIDVPFPRATFTDDEPDEEDEICELSVADSTRESFTYSIPESLLPSHNFRPARKSFTEEQLAKFREQPKVAKIHHPAPATMRKQMTPGPLKTQFKESIENGRSKTTGMIPDFLSMAPSEYDFSSLNMKFPRSSPDQKTGIGMLIQAAEQNEFQIIVENDGEDEDEDDLNPSEVEDEVGETGIFHLDTVDSSFLKSSRFLVSPAPPLGQAFMSSTSPSPSPPGTPMVTDSNKME